MSEENTRVITREQAEEWDLHYDAPGELHREEIDRHRWYFVELAVFTAPDDGLVYGVSAIRPLTEIQEDMDPWNDEKTVTLTRYESYEKTVTAWRPVGSEPTPPAPDYRALLAEAIAELRDSSLRTPNDVADDIERRAGLSGQAGTEAGA